MERDTRNKQDLPEGFAARTIARLLEQGRKDRLYMRMGDARARFREALEVFPDHPEALMELGRTYDPIEGPSQEEEATLQRAAVHRAHYFVPLPDLHLKAGGPALRVRSVSRNCQLHCEYWIFTRQHPLGAPEPLTSGGKL